MKVERLPVTACQELVNGFMQISLEAPEHALHAKPGHYVTLENNISCYLMSADGHTLTLIINKALLPEPTPSSLFVSPLKGEEIEPPLENLFHLVQAHDEGLNAVIFYLKKYRRQFQGLVLLEGKQFPFKPCPSRLLIPGIPNDVIAAIPLFEDWHIAHRLVSSHDQPGCFIGTIDELATIWINQTKIAKPLKKLYIAKLSELATVR